MNPTEKDFALARVMLAHSLKIKPKEKVLITVDERAISLGKAVFQETLKMGAYPMLEVQPSGLEYSFYKLAGEWQLRYVPTEVIKAKINWADAYVIIATEDSGWELSRIESAKISTRTTIMRPYKDQIVDTGRWVLTFYPTQGMAKQAGMTLPALKKFYFASCLVDYQAMERGLAALEIILDKGSEIHVVGKKTDLRIKIAGRLAQACSGECNIPDGEVFLAPLSGGVNGKVYLDLPSMAYGKRVEGVYLEFVDGIVVKSKADKGNRELQRMLETDVGARRLGEFAIGANFQVKRAMRSTIFDEKIGGTVHMALGRAFLDKRGGGENKSSIHWDIVKDMRLPGSVLTVDGKVVLSEGKLLV